MTERGASVASDKNLSFDARRAALIQLAAETRQELSRRFPAAAVAEMDAATSWISDFEQGRVRVYLPTTSGYGTIGLPTVISKQPGGP
jgi:hypothetical protein